MSTRKKVIIAVAAAVALLLVVAAITAAVLLTRNDYKEDEAPTTTIDEGIPSDVEEAIIYSYDNAWQTFMEAQRTANPNLPALSEWHTASHMVDVVDVVTTTADNGWIVVGNIEPNPQISNWDGSTTPGSVAEITDCIEDNSEYVDPDTGEEQGKDDRTEYGVKVQMVVADNGVWQMNTVVQFDEACN